MSTDGDTGSEDVRLRALDNIIRGLPDLEAEWPEMHEEERWRLSYEWDKDTHNLFGELEDLDRGVSPWRDPDHRLDAEQRERYAAIKRRFREAMQTIERLDLSTHWFPEDLR